MKHRTGHIYKRGNVFWLQYRIEGRFVQQSLNTTDREEAEQKRKKIMRQFTTADLATAHAIVESQLRSAEKKAQAAIDDAHPPLAIADAWTAYERAKKRPDSSERTLSGYESAWKRFKAWMNKTHPDKTFMRDIDAEIASDYAQQLTADKVASSTFNQHIGLLRLVWRCLAVQIRAGVNPWMEIAKRRTQKLAHRRRTIMPEQFEKLLAAAGTADLHDLLFVLGLTGQRLVDGVMLRWDCIDFKRCVITLNPRKTARYGKAVFIPLLPALAELLKKRRNMTAGELVFPELAAEYQRDSSIIPKHIQKAFMKAGLTPKENRPGIKRAVVVYGAHSLRHYFATQALAAGIPGEIVKRITGHTSDAMLEGYEHVDAAMIGGLAAKLSNGKPLTTLPPPQTNIREQVRTALNRMNTKNWKTVRADLLASIAT
jgi:integrase